jgi:hypothetical protein
MSGFPKKGTVKRKNKDRSEYFQSIARYFFKQRGAPFFLSSRELELVSKWEDIQIPLPVVLEGIKRAFETYKRKPGRKTRIQTISFCERQVLNAFDQYRERKVGKERMRIEGTEKRKLAKAEIKTFLDALPEQIGYLREAYSRAQKLLSGSSVEEEKLEQIEGEVEELIRKHSSVEEKERIKKSVYSEYKVADEEEFSKIFKIKLVKDIRDRYKIPYISLFYY